ncbi:carbohydrate-binding family 9-like protein [Rufibacter sp. XAAS-G3-1]|uniref:carbohydrate-binding family 9-like protein n=1 Tax=Rufibacter sp. XAAS-G3-1 TaxID=2729134 RepID=UPI0015E768C9|nr:carbohydrate-binding family 9-like protein [Rufibacter sp. XAAS-G3-1]
MQKIAVPYIATLHEDSAIHQVSDALNALDKISISVTPWHEFKDKPSVKFAVAHNHDCLFIKFYVLEKSVRAVYRRDTDPVYKDSCVEFFISFNQDKSYYNLEFNCLGTCTIGYGSNREGRVTLPEEVTKKIKRFASLRVVQTPGREPEVKWELTLIIPISTFCFNSFNTLKEQWCRVNFYKCGDDLPTPHYLSWSYIEAEEPNFHLPEFFGELQLL